MKMIRHATTPVNDYTKFGPEIAKFLDKLGIIPIVIKDYITLITAIDYMIAGIRIFDFLKDSP